ncbi:MULTISPECIES: RCC1 domain-containing protein [Methylosinus]|uniref:RCC1 domain-containing protein n=1 Tax=Methylosinus TaxID=425 RepID=UPI001FCC8E8B|nr:MULTISPECIES: hypothetical protein [Methylosinus]
MTVIEDNICEDSSTPVSVPGLSTGVVAIAAGYGHTCALTATGAVKCWGLNWHGQLGDGTTTSRSVPVPVSGLSSGVVAIATGDYYSCALTIAGAVKCWGWNLYGQLGDGTLQDRHSPVSVSGLSSGVSAISSAALHSCALTRAHGVKCWGKISDGSSGGIVGSTPKDFGTFTGLVAIDAGNSRACALKGDGALLCLKLGQGGVPIAEPIYTRGVVASAGGSACVSMASGAVTCRLTCCNMPKLPSVTALVRARASLLVNSLGVGTHTLRATYSGDAAHSQSSGSRAQTIVP